MTALTYRYVAMTDTGLRRSNNQDSGYASPHLIAIADGMGGAAAGDLASSQVLDVIRGLDHEPKDALEELAEAVTQANLRLGRLIEDDPAVEGMGTTLEAMLWDGEKFAVAHIGDSRAYRLRDGKLTQISVDHTFVQSLVEEGRISPEEARVHPHRSLLLRALLGRDDNAPDLSWLQPAAGDRYLLCSDGLSDMLRDETIEQTMRAETIDVVATDLVRQALEAGGYDNVSVVLAEFVPIDTPMDETLSCADGRPQIVGALANAPQPRSANSPDPHPSGTGTGSATDDEDAAGGDAGEPELDEEELRYAPRPPGRHRWIRWVLTPLIVLVAIGALLGFAWHWSQQQYYVGVSQGRVAIFRGVQVKIPGIDTSSVAKLTDIEVDSLPTYQQGRVEAGIEAPSRADADAVIRSLTNLKTSTPATPTPTATSATEKPTTKTATPSRSP